MRRHSDDSKSWVGRDGFQATLIKAVRAACTCDGRSFFHFICEPVPKKRPGVEICPACQVGRRLISGEKTWNDLLADFMNGNKPGCPRCYSPIEVKYEPDKTTIYRKKVRIKLLTWLEREYVRRYVAQELKCTANDCTWNLLRNDVDNEAEAAIRSGVSYCYRCCAFPKMHWNAAGYYFGCFDVQDRTFSKDAEAAMKLWNNRPSTEPPPPKPKPSGSYVSDAWHPGPGDHIPVDPPPRWPDD